MTKNKLIIISCIAGLVLIFVTLIIIGVQISNKKSDVINNKPQEEFGFEPEKPEFDEEEQINANTINVFLTELMGEDYTLLLELFAEPEIPEDVQSIDDPRYLEYATLIGSEIKDYKKMERAEIIQDLQNNDGSYKFAVVLYFTDGTQKQLELLVKDGLIQTPIKSFVN